MVNSTLLSILWTARRGSQATRATALLAATVYLRSLPSPDTGSQLTYREEYGRGLLYLLAYEFSECEQAAAFLSLVIERSRKSCGTTALISHTTALGRTPLHDFAANCSNLSLAKTVLREHPPSLTLLTSYGRTPLNLAELFRGSTSEITVFLRTASAAYDASNPVALVALCDGSSPYLARAIHRQTIALRSAVAICLNRQEEAPSALFSAGAGVALSLLERLRDFGRVGNSSDLLRVVLEFVGP